jgi:hypothetical protein
MSAISSHLSVARRQWRGRSRRAQAAMPVVAIFNSAGENVAIFGCMPRLSIAWLGDNLL